MSAAPLTAALHFRALAALPAPLAALVRAHEYANEIADLVQEAALAALLAKPGDSAQQIYNRARSRVRRFTQDPAHHGACIDGREVGAGAASASPTRKQVRARVQADLGLSTRSAQRALKKQLERMRQNGDLFAGDESEVPV